MRSAVAVFRGSSNHNEKQPTSTPQETAHRKRKLKGPYVQPEKEFGRGRRKDKVEISDDYPDCVNRTI
jgi:hypothetical protein